MTWNNGEARVGMTNVSLRGSVAMAVASGVVTAAGGGNCTLQLGMGVSSAGDPTQRKTATESAHAYSAHRDLALLLGFLARGGCRSRRAELSLLGTRRAGRPHGPQARRQSVSAVDVGAAHGAAEDDDAPRSRWPENGAKRAVQRHAALAAHGRLRPRARRAGALQLVAGAAAARDGDPDGRSPLDGALRMERAQGGRVVGRPRPGDRCGDRGR